MRRMIWLTSTYLLVALLISGAASADDKAPAKKAKPAAEKKVPEEKKKAEPAKEADKKEEAEKKPAAEEKKPEPKTHTVKPGLLKVDLSLDGTFEAQKMAEVVVRPETWSSFKVLEAVKHGDQVRRGEVLVEFDPKTLDEAISDHQATERLADLSFQQAEAELEMLESTTPLSVAQAERDNEYGDEDLARYYEIDKPMTLESLKQNLQMSKNYLEYEQEELKQLEQMYNEDELTEETEEIVLRRQRDAVRRSEFSYEMARTRYERDMNVSLPRDEVRMKHSDRLSDLSYEKTLATLPMRLAQTKLELEKQKVSRERSAEKLKKLLADRELMTLKSPLEGTVYFGRCTLGKWSSASTWVDKLRPGGSVSANSPFMTIVQTRPLLVRVTVPEKELHWVKPGLRGTVKATGYPDVKATAVVSSVDPIPSAARSFMAVLRVTLGSEGGPLMPGMKCKIELTPYLKKTALTVPASAVSTDELNSDVKYIHLLAGDGAVKKRSVTVGQKSGEKVEILRGVKAGDKVLVEAPKKE